MLSQFVQAVLVGAVSVWGNRKERRSYVATTRRGGPGGAPGPNARKRQYPIPQTGTKAKHRGERPAARKRDPSRAERRRERERTFQTESTQNKTDPSSGKEQPTALFHRLFLAYFSFVFACVGLVDADSGGRHELRDHTPRAYASDALVERFRCFVPWVIAKKEDG